MEYEITRKKKTPSTNPTVTFIRKLVPNISLLFENTLS